MKTSNHTHMEWEQ